MQSNLEDMELFWPKSDLTDNFKLLAIGKDQEKHLAPFLLEMSASVWGMEHFTHFLRGRHFTLYTDHKPLVNLGAVHNKALSQIQEAMIKYDFEIMYQKGSEMPADFLS